MIIILFILLKDGEKMFTEIIVTSAIGMLAYQINKSNNIDAESEQKYVKAFSNMANAEDKLKRCQDNLANQLMICAKRKTAIINCHLEMFKKEFEYLRKINFVPGRGIEEIERINEIGRIVDCKVPALSIKSTTEMSDTQIMISFALYGIGGLAVKESKMNLKTASKNLAQSNAMSAQVDTVCIALDAISKHTEIVTNLLQRLGMLYMKSIKNVSSIISRNGLAQENYSQEDVDAINVSLMLTKLIYRIINTPLIDESGSIEKESIKVIEEGKSLLEAF